MVKNSNNVVKDCGDGRGGIGHTDQKTYCVGLDAQCNSSAVVGKSPISHLNCVSKSQFVLVLQIAFRYGSQGIKLRNGFRLHTIERVYVLIVNIYSFLRLVNGFLWNWEKWKALVINRVTLKTIRRLCNLN